MNKIFETMIFQNNTQRGLVFIEMLVVVALIGLLVSIVVTSIAETRKQARDSVRILNVRELSKALSLYYLETNHFPISRKLATITGEDALSQELLKEGIVNTALRDPLHPDYAYYYVSNARGTNYILGYCIETDIFEKHLLGCGNTLSP